MLVLCSIVCVKTKFEYQVITFILRGIQKIIWAVNTTYYIYAKNL